MRNRPLTVATTASAVGLLILVLSGCGGTIPTDPDGTLTEATGGILRVGVTDNEQFVDVQDGDDPVGIEPDLIRSFASSIDADVQWVPGSEQELVKSLEHADLDLVIGGLADDTPWSTDAGMTRPYMESTDEQGKTVKHVILVRRGENALLLTLDTFLLDQDDAL